MDGRRRGKRKPRATALPVVHGRGGVDFRNMDQLWDKLHRPITRRKIRKQLKTAGKGGPSSDEAKLAQEHAQEVAKDEEGAKKYFAKAIRSPLASLARAFASRSATCCRAFAAFATAAAFASLAF